MSVRNRGAANNNKSKSAVSASSSSSVSAKSAGGGLRIAFLHPNLGIGGAERLVVDCASALQQSSLHSHHVEFFTNYHDVNHCYIETRDGSFPVHVYASTTDNLFGKFRVLIAILRMVYLSLVFALFHAKDFDVCFVDQVSHGLPILRYFTKCRILFYCHFPDQLLSKREGLLKRLYRAPVDWMEETTTGMSDLILVNSYFTLQTFQDTFPRLQHLVDKKLVQVLYPSIDFARYTPLSNEQVAALAPKIKGEVSLLQSLIYGKDNRKQIQVLTSINRFERKKNIPLAVEAFVLLQKQLKDAITKSSSSSSSKKPAAAALPVRLLISGGYDPVNIENIEHFQELWSLVESSGCRPIELLNEKGADAVTTLRLGDKTSTVSDKEAPIVYFLRSFTDAQRAYLLSHSLAVLYTPSNEHFGIVPVEAMYMRRPVVAVNSGGPVESVCDYNAKATRAQATGFLCPPEPQQWSEAFEVLVQDEEAAAVEGRESLAVAMGNRGRVRVTEKFHFNTFQNELEQHIMHLKRS